MIVGESREAIARWLAARVAHFTVGSTPYSTVGLLNGAGELIAAVVYDNFTRINIEMHIALAHPHAMTKHFCGEIFRYPFLALGVKRISTRVAAKNLASRRLCLHFGLTEEGRAREACPDGDDLILFGLLARECRWLEVGKRG